MGAAEQLLLPTFDTLEPRQTPKWGFWTLNTARSGERMQQRSYMVDQMPFVLANIDKDVDSYMSQAFFRQRNRRALNVEYVTHSYVDLDTYNCPHLAGFTRDQILYKLLAYCDDEGIPVPSYIVFSGRGIYLKWAWKHCLPRKAVGRLVAVNKCLVGKFSYFGADPKAVDVSRILRVIGTTNSKSGERAKIIYENKVGGETVTYDFDLFADEVLPYTRAQIQEWRKEKAKRKPKFSQAQILSFQKYHSRNARAAGEEGVRAAGVEAFWYDWHWNVVEDLRRLAALRYPNGTVPEGKRDLFGHLMSCQLAHVIQQNLYQELVTYCGLILPKSYVNQDLRHHASSLLERHKLAQKGQKVEFNGKKYSPVYTYKKSTMIDLLEIKPDEMRQMSALIDTTEKYRRNNERRSKTGLTREQYESQSISRAKPWEALGISRASYYRRKKAGEIDGLEARSTA